MNQDVFDATTIGYGSALYLLKLLYEKALKITDIAVGDLIHLDSPLLNHYYSSTLFLIGKLLERNDLETLVDGTKYLFPTLIGYEDLDTEWRVGRSDAYTFLAKIESKWLEAGKPVFDFPPDLQKVFDDMDEAMTEYKKQLRVNEKAVTSNLTKNKPFTSSGKLYVPDALLEAEVEGLAAYNDGSIRYKGNPIEMRTQLNAMCRLFIMNKHHFVTVDDIKDEIIDANKREHTSFSTIAKYVSELRKVLEVYFGKDVFPNEKKRGWWFKP